MFTHCGVKQIFLMLNFDYVHRYFNFHSLRRTRKNASLLVHLEYYMLVTHTQAATGPSGLSLPTEQLTRASRTFAGPLRSLRSLRASRFMILSLE